MYRPIPVLPSSPVGEGDGCGCATPTEEWAELVSPGPAPPFPTAIWQVPEARGRLALPWLTASGMRCGL